MNLTIDPWIPVVWEDGRANKVSLLDAFQQGDKIRDLAVRPHERIALMRLLICIAQAALDGPKDHADWETCIERLSKTAAEYLANWKHAFELFGNGQRFMQIPAKIVKTDEDDLCDVSKLNLCLATGNNSTLFDNAGGMGRRFCEPELALNLLTYQNYSPLVGRGYKGRSPCIENNMLHTYMLGSSLTETIWNNLLTVEQVEMYMGKDAKNGSPVWELWKEVLKHTTKHLNQVLYTYIGRLCPVQRTIWLNENGTTMQMGNGLEYPAFREATATMVLHKNKGERVPLSASPNKGVWRELPSITVIHQQEKNGICGPLALHHHEGVQDVVIWSGALVSDGKAKLIDAVESAYLIPASMFSDSGRNLYQKGVNYAEIWERKLGHAIACYRRTLKDEIEGEMWKRGLKVKLKAASHYWTAIEQQVPLLLALMKNPSPLRPEGADKDNWSGTVWGRALVGAARAAYELACPHATPRQLKAYSLGINALFKPDEPEAEKPADEETEE